MFVTSHVLAGTIIGRSLPDRPLVAFGIGVVSHLVMDACPHWTAAAGPESRAEFLRVARRDGIAGLAAMAAGTLLSPAEARCSALAGMVGAALLDLDKPCVHFLRVNPFPVWCRRLHKAIQREAPHRMPHELLVALALAAASLHDARAPRWRFKH